MNIKKEPHNQKIATLLKRSQSNISRELARNKGKKGYRHKQANNFALERHQSKEKAVKVTKEIALLIEKYISED